MALLVPVFIKIKTTFSMTLASCCKKDVTEKNTHVGSRPLICSSTTTEGNMFPVINYSEASNTTGTVL